MTQLFKGYHNWRLSERFPRMTLCKFDVYILQDAQPHWVQCALPINIYIEKMYLIIWTWLWILLVLVLYDLIKICRNICCSQTKLLHADITTNKLLTDKQIEFLDEFRLSPDAFLVLNLIKWNTCKYNVTLIVRNLFDNMVDAHEYNERQKEGK